MSTLDHDDVVATVRAAAARVPASGGPDLGDVLRSGARRRRRRTRSLAVATSGAAAALAVVGVALGAALTGPSVDAALPAAPAPGLALLDRPATADDALPAVLPEGSEAGSGVVPGSLRVLARSAGTGYFVGRDEAGEVCVVLVRVDERTSASSCSSPGRPFVAHGAQVELGGRSGVHGALVVPDGTSPADALRMATLATDAGPGEVGEVGVGALSPSLYVWDTGPAEQAPDGSPTGAGADPDQLLTLLDRPARDEDPAPAGVLGSAPAGAGDVVPGTTRWLGESAGGTFWASHDGRGGYCLLVWFPAEGHGATSCATAADFADDGLMLASLERSPGVLVTALLVPDPWTLDGDPDEDVVLRRASLDAQDRVSDNLLVRSGTAG